LYLINDMLGMVVASESQQRPLHQECSGGWRKDEARPLVTASALCFPQCFDTDGWV